MTITIGRCVLPDPSEVSASGDQITVSGVFYSTLATVQARAAEAMVRELQLTSMVGNKDEEIFPLVWSTDGRYDGYYFCESATWAPINDGGGSIMVASWSTTLRRVVDGPNAIMEQSLLGLVRTNGHSIATATNDVAFVAVPGYTEWLYSGNTYGTVTRNTEAGGELCFLTPMTTTVTSTERFYVLANAYYNGSCVVEYKADDGTWYPLVGRDIPDDAAGRWRLSNGCFRVYPSSTVGTLQLEVYTGTAWESTQVTGNIFVSSAHHPFPLAGTDSVWRPPTVVRNGPDGVAISVSSATTTPSTIAYDCTYTLGRGDHHFEVTMRGSANPGLRSPTTMASTALATATAGLRSTSNDANGNRLVLMATNATTRDLTNGRIYVTASPSVIQGFAAGIELNGSSAATGNTSTDMLYQYLGVTNLNTRMVKR